MRMSDEHDIPVKVVDRRWWARGGDTESNAAADASTKPTYVEELERSVAEKDKQVQEYLTKYRQAAQEFEEARARMRKELAKDAERSRREVLVSFLEVIDNLDRAIDATTQADAPANALLQGVELVRQQFLGKLEGLGVQRIEMGSAGFDPLLHEAVSVVPVNDPAHEGRIVGVVRHGYRIGNEVLRPALVAVAKSTQPETR
jgi:molecular chaperone GrpE